MAVAKYSDQELYSMWVACNRNSAEAARKLGMEAPAFQYHARTKNFAQRYAAEFVDYAEGERRIALIEAFGEIRTMLKVLKDVALDEEQKARDRILAASHYLKFINDAQPIKPPDHPEPEDVIEAYISEDITDAETYVKAAIEANVVDAVERRTSRKQG